MSDTGYFDNLPNPEKLFRSVYENANDAIFLMNDVSFIDCNKKTESMFGCDRTTILKKHPADFSPDDQPDGQNSREKAARLIHAALAGTPQFFEWKHRKQDGTVFDAEVSLTRIEAGNDTVLLAMVRDITRRKKAEEDLQQANEELESRVEQRTEELKKANELLTQEITHRQQTQDALGQSEAQYREFLENFNSIVLEMNSNGDITYMNRYGRKFFGFKKSEIIGKNVIGTIVPAVAYSGEDLRELIRNILHQPEAYFSSENENIRKNGEPVWIAWTNRVIFNPTEDRTEILCIGVDRTAQKQAQNKLAEEIEERAAASERNRLARDLHDAVSQTLFSASLIAEVLPRLWEKDQEEGRKRLEEVRRLSRSALAEMRTLLFELRPAALLEAEIADLLKQLTDMIIGRYHIPVALTTAIDINLLPDIKIAFYRIAQEALNNVTKHAEASEATVSLTNSGNTVVLKVTDNGQGFDVTHRKPDSLGIGIMKERAETIGADLIIESTIGKGTEITVTWNTKEETG